MKNEEFSFNGYLLSKGGHKEILHSSFFIYWGASFS